MINHQLPIVETEACQMDSESVSTLSYIFCQGEHFDIFMELYAWFMAELPDLDRIRDFRDEV